jgi:subtilisin-like proprotein convertase family protein
MGPRMALGKFAVSVGAVLTAAALLGISVPDTEGKVKKKTFSSGNVGLQIPDATQGTASAVSPRIKVKVKGKIKDVNASVRITIPDDRDLELSLEGPTFKGSLLKENGFLNSPKGPNFGAGPASCAGTPTVFDSQATTSILQGQPPFLGSFVPATSLNGFRGGQLKGTWGLEVLDHFEGSIDGTAGSAGVLDCWKLTVRYKPQKNRR